MAEETKTTNSATGEPTTEPTANQTADNKPTLDELMAQLAQANADRDKYKAANDKLSKSEAEMKRQLRAKLTAEEQEAEAKAEAEKNREEELENLRKELNHNKAVAAYKAIANEKTVETLIEAVSEADHNAIALIIENEKKAAVKEAQAEWLKSRPQANAGQYSSMSKEQIMAIPDRMERIQAIAQNQHLF
nr:MAG TPA: Major head protein [Caudoviricetes sp.]